MKVPRLVRMVSVTLLPPAPTTVDCLICGQNSGCAASGPTPCGIQGSSFQDHVGAALCMLSQSPHHGPGHADYVVALLRRQEVVVDLGPADRAQCKVLSTAFLFECPALLKSRWKGGQCGACKSGTWDAS